MRVLVTGGAGLIGSSVSKELLRNGHSVISLDNLSTGRETNIEALTKIGDFEFINGSILDSEIVERLTERVDACFHFAAALGVNQILKNPLKSLRTNVYGTEIVLENAHRRNLPTILASTSEIYGKNPNMPLNEESDRVLGSPDKIRWSYSEAKAIDETIAFSLHKISNWDVKILRFFNTVGPSQYSRYGMVIPNFCQAAIRGEPLKIYGTGNQTRVFCHVNDATSAVMKIWNNSEFSGAAVNIGGDQEVSIRSLAQKIIEISGSPSTIEFVAYSDLSKEGYEDIDRRVPDTSKLRTLTDWKPEYSLEQILIECLNSAKNEQ